jgi:hypothetical protein
MIGLISGFFGNKNSPWFIGFVAGFVCVTLEGLFLKKGRKMRKERKAA